MDSDNSGCALTPADRRNLPRAILLGIDAALHIKNLPRRLRMTLAEIGRHVSQYNATGKTVWPSKSTIAGALGYSARTIYRHIADLEELDLIERLPPPPRTRFQKDPEHLNGHIRLTAHGAQLLGLAGQVIHKATDKSAVPNKQTVVSTSKNHPPTGSKVPEDLKLLEEAEVSSGGIFGLMGEATAKGQRLGDIVAVLGERLRGMRGGGLRNYLRKCIYGQTDWRAKALALREKVRPQQYANRKYAGPGGLIVRVFDGIAEVVRDGVWLENVPTRHMAKVYADIERGRLKPA